ncbi:hypothetical protein CKO28_06600 [Rhodovibrio sodomensis]|uniref:DUF29 domain-containing protein n=1 Tax=Rhodovibrio sodomensis TaxID=1088 RepID=A0ABS1DD77_9PROT|nr:DUF29 family protein [Rhodovibrio sodomensis]MBK1667703.1 hypothetical protein [Rhodovibrio sodomensis]
MPRESKEPATMPGDPLYDTDFYAWPQQQARLLLEVRDNRLDAENLAEEVADLANSGLRWAIAAYDAWA